MRLNQLPTQSRKFFEIIAVVHERNARKIDLQKSSVFVAIGGAVQHRIDITQNFLGLIMMAVFLVDEGAELRRKVFNSLFAFEGIVILKGHEFLFFVFWKIV